MRFPVPDFKAEECARDLAADIRNIYLPRLEQIETELKREYSQKLVEEANMLRGQIKSMMETEIQCIHTDRIYVVGDYAWSKEVMIAKRLEIRKRFGEKVAEGYRRLIRTLQ